MSTGIFLLRKYSQKYSSDMTVADAYNNLKKETNGKCFFFIGNLFFDHEGIVWQIIAEFTLHYEINRKFNFLGNSIYRDTIYTKDKFNDKMLLLKIDKNIEKEFTHFLYG